MLKFLRYNSRHNFYWRSGGWPKIDPISSTYGGGVRTVSLYEPLWLFRLRKRLFAFSGRQRCGRRDDMFAMNRGDGPQPDTWDLGPDSNRTCSYCGSLHPDDLMKICHLVMTDERYAIEGTTKSYKVYVSQPGVRNASEGAVKFYMHHAPKEPTDNENQLFRDAVRISNERFLAMKPSWVK